MKPIRRVMIDIETLATVPTAAVIAVAATIQQDGVNHVAGRSWAIDPDLAIGHRDPDTIAWWKQQSEPVRQFVWGGNQTPHEVYNSMRSWFAANLAGFDGEIRVYADPAMFDLPILRHQFHVCGLEVPWSWRDERCLRSLKKELKDTMDIEPPPFENEMRHHPMNDCLEQNKELEWALSALGHIAEGWEK